ncbi:aminoacyl tRNA synthase complex-interacting multifunctional protein 1 [Wyeomyia smithii]|uniref:aminoacyl tRNA synthase complex-interacting multifunctional protein 1 n=1 Tax=Wyeomyia smithii TaxID=174621 RepID=UPI002467BB16|nr:aminoacyl tRNA synthase complex-interacting multifunctional protein 1 [Wyeomyia smithii]XP_055529688.1 aminoacyl tRNA synthase complex-interacting multifunctional protein 1 [Wyeomyia smithii]
MLNTRFLLIHKAISARILSRKLFIRMESLERVISNNAAAEQLLQSLKEELKTINDKKVSRRIEELKVENDALRKQVESARKKLIDLETQNGKKQIPVPGISTDVTPIVDVKVEPEQPKVVQASQQSNETKPPKEKKAKKEKPKDESKPSASGTDEPPIDVGRLDMRVGKIVEVSRHPDADSLYLEKIDCGESASRTVISGLVKFIPIEEMQNRLVVVLCNLKPAKMRGILSEAMVMCASSPDKVEILAPPENSVPGDLVHVEGYPRMPDAVMNPKKKIFETVAPDLRTNDLLVACYKDSPFQVPGKGVVKAQTLKNVNVK